MEVELRIPSENPSFPEHSFLGASLYTPASPTSQHSIVVIVHGHAGHRDYCYQRSLSRALSVRSIRFDFSGCGAQLGPGTMVGTESQQRPRTIESDLRDLETVLRYVRGEGYLVTALVGHSRGAVVSLQYAKRDASIPVVVNCSGRFRGHLIHEKIRRNPNIKAGVTGYWETQRAGTGGPLVRKWTLLSEIDSVGAQEMTGIGGQLSRETDVLVVFGTKDNIVPVVDAGMFVNELRERAELALIQDADHNFFVQPTDAADPKATKINKNEEVAQVVARYLSPEATRLRFLARQRHLRVPRFPDVEGMSNFRDLGGYGSFPVGFMYRGADLSGLTSTGARQLATYVSTIIDLRSEIEVSMNGTIGPTAGTIESIPGIVRLHVPVFRHVDYSPAGLSKFFGPQVKSERDREQNMLRAYISIFKNSGPIFKALFTALADTLRSETAQARRGVMIHCSAGKDRTGVICATMLLLAGVPLETIALEYELTTYGLTSEKLRHSAVAATASPSRDGAEDDEPPIIGSGSTAETMRLFLHYMVEEISLESHLLTCVPSKDYHLVKNYLQVQKSRL